MKMTCAKIVGAAFSLLAFQDGLASEATPPQKPIVVPASGYVLTPPLRDVVPSPSKKALRMTRQEAFREQPLGRLPRNISRKKSSTQKLDPVVQQALPPPSMPGPLMTFEGIDNIDGVYPPDSNGDVGLNYYVEMVNLHMCIYDKVTGTNVVAPFLMSTLFNAAGFSAPASNTDDGDPVVLYDHLANRWFISQFIVSVTPPHEVIGISQTSDPTGAWHLYDFVMPNDKMNDYPHFGMWPDAYYMTDNQFDGNSWGGAGVFAFDRAKMLVGDPAATYQYFDLFSINSDFGGMLPADLDGPLPPEGTPGYFLMVDDSYVNSFDAMYLWEFHVDWTNPANTTFGQASHPNRTNAVADFDSDISGGRNNIPQPDTAQKLDAISDRLMHRVQYRNFGSYETLAASHTVDVGVDHAGVRWYQMRRNLPGGEFEVFDQGTFAPDDAHRWMGSVALDGQGNMAIGYTVSSTSIYPSIRYAGRLATDPTGGLFQGEAEMYAGSGSQTGSGARWGDYTMLSVDPADEVTFWYVNEYYPATAAVAWHTRIGTFRLGFPEQGVVIGKVTNALTGEGISGALITSDIGYSTPTVTDGMFTFSLKTGTVTLTATALDYEPSAPEIVDVMLDTTTTQNFALSPIPLRVLPHADFSSSGLEGGPFTPVSTGYILTNSSVSSLTWTSALDTAWAARTPQGGVLPAGAATTVWVSLNFAADLLEPGSYSGTLSFSNITAGTGQDRSVVLEVNPNLLDIVCEDFNGGLPGGWLVRTNGDLVSTAAWRFDSPNGRENRTGGSATYAAVDDDMHGSTVLTDTEMISATYDLSGISSPTVEFKTDFLFYESEVVDVDVSTTGIDGPWINEWSQSNSYQGDATVDLSTYADEPSVNVRFRYNDNGGWGWWWQVDDFCLKGAIVQNSGDLGIKPAPGLSAEGYAQGPFNPSRAYRLTNNAAGSLTWTTLVDAAWVTVTPAGGALTANASIDISVEINASATTLAPNVYSGQIIVSNVTEGLFQTRPLSLRVIEPLAVSPAGALLSGGLEGGPFTPPSKVYVISNAASHVMTVDVSSSQPWLTLSSAGASLAGGEVLSLTSSFNSAALTIPGVYSDSIVFSNVTTSIAQSRAVTVTVVEIRGDIEIYDSVSPTNDLEIPFGTIAPFTSATQSIRVVNSDAPGGRDLTLENIYLGYVYEDFSDGQAQGWREDVDSNWNITSGRYIAQAPSEDYLTAVYTSSVSRADVAIEAECYRDGTLGWAQGLGLRVSEDFDADGVGKGYLFVFDGDSYYGVFWIDGATSGELQGWSLSTAIKSGDTNHLAASAEGSTLHFFMNGTLIWTGTDTRFSTGRVALAGYDEATDQPAYQFDDVVVRPPVTPLAGIGGKQRYLNSFPIANSEPYGTVRAQHVAIPPAPDFPPEPPSTETTIPPFSIENLPALPVTLTPGDTMDFDVAYSPFALGTNRNVVTVNSDDNDEPFLSVAVHGQPSQGMITGIVTSANTGFGLAGVAVNASSGLSNWTAVTTSSGAYTLPALEGIYTVTAMLGNYTTGIVSGIEVVDGGITNVDFDIGGSELTYAPTGMVVVLNYGQSQTNTIWLTNSGPLSVDVRLAARMQSANSLVSIPVFTGSIPSSADSPSAAMAPADKKVNASAPTIAAPTKRLCYGVDINGQRLVSFYTDAPGTFTVIGSTGANLIPAIDFLNYDFTHLYALDSDANTLVRISTTDGSKTTVGTATPASGQTWTDMTVTPDGVMYASSTDGSSSKLYTLNPNNGTATFIGNITGAPGIIALASDNLGQLYGLDLINDALFSVNALTGAGTSIGSIGFDANYAQGMDFDEEDNVLYLAAYNNDAGRGELRIADVLTGNTTLVGQFENGAEMCIAVVSESRPAWVVLPQPTTTLASASSSTLPVVFDSRGVDNEPSTNTGEFVFSGTFVNNPPRLPVTMIIIADDLSVTPSEAAASTGIIGGPFAPTDVTYAISNRGPGTISWSISNDVTWITTPGTGGTLTAGTSVSFNPSINAEADGFVVGTYTATLHFVNQSSGVYQDRSIILTVTPIIPDYFTELFTGANDLDYSMLTFAPLPGTPYYEVCRSNGVTSFPTDMSGGTTLSIGDDDYVEVSFTGGLTTPFYNTSRSGLFIGSNGYITFDDGDSALTGSLANHFNQPRISMLFDDLDPSSGGTVSWKQLGDRVAVTWLNVPEYATTSQNSFQTELFTNGTIRLTWLNIDDTVGLAGLSQGLGEPTDFTESDLSAFSACVFKPGLMITNPSADIFVASYITTYDVEGDCDTANFDGMIGWSNSLTGASGSIPVQSSWQIPAIALNTGSNMINVVATNSVPAVSLQAYDHGTNTAYNSGWADGSNGGTGWASGWQQFSWSGTGEFFMTTSDPGNLSAAPSPWTLSASNGATAEARRELAQPLSSGQSLIMRFDNNWVEPGYSVGFGLQNAAADNLFEFLFIGNDSTYIINDSTNSRATSIPWSGDGWNISFTLTSTDTYVLTCDVYTVEGQILSTADQSPIRIKFWNYSAGPGWERNLYINDLRVIVPGTSSGSTNDSVTITRLAAGADGDEDGMLDDWELENGLIIGVNDATNNPDLDVWANIEEFIADTNPNTSNEPLRIDITTSSNGLIYIAGPSTTNSRQYDIGVSSNLLQSMWSPWQSNLTGNADGNALMLIMTNGPDENAARVGVHLP